jgi:large subunit ribosomal protein L24
MKLKVGDRVLVISGKDKGKEGKITKTIKTLNKVIVENINMIKRHTKPDGNQNQGGIIEKEAPINVSNVKLINREEKKVEKKNTKKTVSVDKKEKKDTKVKSTKKTTKKVD